MERLFVLVLALGTLVTGTPHGYGVKGGASAKAEASAVAGGFGDLGPIPLSIPSGSGYSGSFSKSSSSSFASSSASSSSSSFSFSGSGTNGIAGIGNGKGCLSGTCPGAGNAGSSLDGQHPTGVNAVSAAQAKALSGSYAPCQGSHCNGSPAEKCTSGQCLTDSTKKDQNGCTGNCHANSSPSETESAIQGSSEKEEDKNESNDFSVNIHGKSQSKSSPASNGESYDKGKSYNSEPGCTTANCGATNSDQSSLGNNQNQQPAPSKYLITPNQSPPCTTPNCNYPSQHNNLQTGNLPSSYNVPIQSATNPPGTYYSPPSTYGKETTHPNVENGIPCTSSNCNSNPYNIGTPNIPHQHSGQSGPGNQGPCASGQCGSPPSSNGKATTSGVVPGGNVPSYPHGSIPSSTPIGQSGQPGCTTPYCSGIPTYSSQPTNQPSSGCNGAGCSYTPQSTSQMKPSDSNAPIYTGGFGGPAGFLETPTSSKLPGNSVYNHGHHTPSTSGSDGTFGSIPTQGSLGPTKSNELHSDNHYGGSTQTSSNGESSGTFEYNNPSTQLKPLPTHSNGSPTGSSFVPLGSNPSSDHTGAYKPSITHTGSTPVYSGGIDSSTGLSHTGSGSNSFHGSFGVTKPGTPLPSHSNPTYTGNTGSPGYTSFGGPAGSGESSLSFGSAGNINKPGFGNCVSAACKSQPDANINGGTTSPIASGSSQNKPTYTGGFGGPTGFLKPNDFNVPSNTPTTGNVPCVNGNCSPKGTPSSSPGGSAVNTHNLAVAAASANAEVYSGGFGGPPGFLKPYDNGKGNIPAHGNHGSSENSPSSNTANPDTLSVNGKNSEPGIYTNGANAVAHATASASAGAGSSGINNGALPGCNSGCNTHGAGDGNHGLHDGLTKNGLGSGSLASAKSSAGAYGFGGNFAGSSASAHASAGTATKGGYGRK